MQKLEDTQTIKERRKMTWIIIVMLLSFTGCATTKTSPYQSQYTQIWELYAQGKIDQNRYYKLKEDIVSKEQEYYYQQELRKRQWAQALSESFKSLGESYKTEPLYRTKTIYTDCDSHSYGNSGSVNCRSRESAW